MASSLDFRERQHRPSLRARFFEIDHEYQRRVIVLFRIAQHLLDESSMSNAIATQLALVPRSSLGDLEGGGFGTNSEERSDQTSQPIEPPLGPFADSHSAIR